MFKHIIQDDYIIVNSLQYPVTNVTLIKDCSDDGNLIGTAVAKSLKFKTDADIDFENLEFKYYAGLGNASEYECIPIGTFIVVDFSEDEHTGIKTVSALDTMLRFNIPYVSELNYDGAVTINDVLTECCEKCDVPLKAGQNITNKDFIVDGNQFEDGALFRNVIQAIAQISGSFAQIENDELVFAFAGRENAPTIDSTNYETLNWKRSTWPINTVVIGNSKVTGENVTLTDGSAEQNTIAIYDNPFAYSQEKREQLIQGLYDKLYGFDYVSYELKNCVANPSLPLGHPISIITPEGETLRSFVFCMEYNSPEGCSSLMSAPSITRAAVEYQFIPAEREIMRRTEILVDKANSYISAVAEDLQKNLSSQIEVTTDSILAVVQDGYARQADLEDINNKHQSSLEILGDQIELKFNTVQQYAQDVEGDVQTKFDEYDSYFNFSTNGLDIGQIGNSLIARLSNERLAFLQNNVEIAYISNNKMYITEAQIQNKMTIGNYDWIVKANGNLSLKRRTS